MRFIVENFGPIVKADIDIKPLTLFIGSNASGKSYLLYLIWTLLNAEPEWQTMFEKGLKVYDDVIRRRVKRKNEEAITRGLLDFFYWFIDNLGNLITKSLKDLLENTFMASSVSELVGPASQETKILILSEDTPSLVVKFNRSNGFEVTTPRDTVQRIKRKLTVKIDSLHKSRMVIRVFHGKKVIARGTLPLDEAASFANKLIAGIPYVISPILGYCPLVPTTSILPDGRAGILRLLEPVSRVLISTRGITLTVSEVDRDFFRHITSITPKIKDQRVSLVANFMEEELGIKLQYIKEGIPKFSVLDTIRRYELPLERAPSGIRELVPLILTMKYTLRPGFLLLIEEPEAHLHPDAQSIVARALSLLANLDVYTLITTHSIHIIDEINNLIRLNKLNAEDKETLGYMKEEGLDPNKVAAYIVERETGMVWSSQVTDEGLSETSLDKVLSEIANRYVRVEERARGFL